MSTIMYMFKGYRGCPKRRKVPLRLDDFYLIGHVWTLYFEIGLLDGLDKKYGATQKPSAIDSETWE